MTFLKKLSHTTNRALASASALVLTSGVASAQQGGGVAVVATALEKQLQAIPGLLTTGAYVLGAGLTIAGLFKLKSYVEDKSGDDLQVALIRLGVGGMLLVIPWVLQTSQDTLGADAAVSGGNLQGDL